MLNGGASPSLAQIAHAVQACPSVAGLHPGADGAIVTTTTRGRVVGLFLHDESLVVGVTRRGGATTSEVARQVRTAVAAHAPHLYVTVSVVATRCALNRRQRGEG